MRLDMRSRVRRNSALPDEGIAIVSVLMVLATVFVLAVASLVLTNSNLMMSGNQVSSSIARSNAEAGIDAMVAALYETYKADGQLPSSPPLVSVTGVGSTIEFEAAPTRGGVPWYRLVSDKQVALRIVGKGPRNGEYLAEALVEFTGEGGSGGSPFRGSVVACESAKLSGSGRIDSFDSRLGRYDVHNPGTRGDVLTLADTGIAQLTGNSPIFGDVNAAGGVRVTGSSPIKGDIHANGLVDLAAGGGKYPGSVRTQGDVRFSSSSEVSGDVLANGGISFHNWGARIFGDAQAGGAITKTTTADLTIHVPSGNIRQNSSPGVPPVPIEDCDPLQIAAVANGFKSLPSPGNLAPDWWPYTRWELTPSGARRRSASNGNWESTPFTAQSVELFGRTVPMIVVDNFNLAAGEETRITGGDVVLFVDGDFIAEGNHKMLVDPGSSLTMIVTGKTKLGASFEMLDGSDRTRAPLPVNDNGLPTFSIFSSYSGADGVNLAGNGKLTASIYAPLTDMKIAGSGETYGSLRARNITVQGGAALHYDEALGAIDIGGGTGSDPEDFTVRILSRR